MCARCRCNTPASKLRWFGGCGAGALLLSSVALVIATFVRDALADFVNQQLIDNFILSSPASGQVGRQMKIGHRIDTVKSEGSAFLASVRRFCRQRRLWGGIVYFLRIQHHESRGRGGGTSAARGAGNRTSGLLVRCQKYLVKRAMSCYAPPLALRRSYNNKKFNVSWTSNADRLSYKQYEYYRRSPPDAALEALYSVNVTTLNLPLIASLGIAGVPFVIDVSDALAPWRDPSKLFITRTAEEVLFGWKDVRALQQASRVPDETKLLSAPPRTRYLCC